MRFGKSTMNQVSTTNTRVLNWEELWKRCGASDINEIINKVTSWGQDKLHLVNKQELYFHRRAQQTNTINHVLQQEIQQNKQVTENTLQNNGCSISFCSNEERRI